MSRPPKSVALVLIGDINMDGRVQKQILTLKSHGHQVTLIQWPHRRLGSSYEHLGIEVINYPHRLHRRAAFNFLRQILFNAFAVRHLKRLAPDIIQCNDLNTLLAGFLCRHRARVIYDAHELGPETRKGVRKYVWSALERWMVPGCHAFIQPEKNRLAYFSAKYHIDPSRIALIENFPTGNYAFSGRNRLREYFALPSHSVILLYTGAIGPGRDIESIVDSMSFLGEDCVLVLLGPSFKNYELELARRVDEARIKDRVLFHPPIPNVDMLDYVHSSDIGLVFYQNTNLNNYWCASNKLYEFIVCGKPVVTNDYPGLRMVVEANQLGVCLPETAPRAIAGAVRQLREALRPPTPPSPYIWENQEATYLMLYE